MSEIVFVGPPVSVVYIGPRPNPVSLSVNFVPATYAEFVRLYYVKIRRMVIGCQGVNREEVDDVVQGIVLDFIAGDYLSIYSPSKQRHYADRRYEQQQALYEAGKLDFAPVHHEGKFGSFVFEFVKLRLRGISDRFRRRASVMQSLEGFLLEQDSGEETSLTEVFGAEDNEYVNIDVRQALQQAVLYLQQSTTATETRNFTELLVTMVDNVFAQGSFDRDAYAASKGITLSAVSMQLRELRSLLKACGFYGSMLKISAGRNKQVNVASL